MLHSQTIKEWFANASVLKDRFGDDHTAYSFRHTYATERLLAGVSAYTLSKNMGTSIQYIKKHYDHTTNLLMVDELTK